MALVLAAEYDCGIGYETAIPRTMLRRRSSPSLDDRVRKSLIKDLTKILDARHERECDACYQPDVDQGNVN